MYLATELAQEPQSIQAWVALLIGAVVTLLSGGGVAAVIKARVDKRDGIAQSEVAEDDALAKRWQTLIETQTKILLEPLQLKVSGLETEVTKLKDELSATHRKYWSAIGYIRNLLVWFNKHMPDGMENTQIPQPPAHLTEDI